MMPTTAKTEWSLSKTISTKLQEAVNPGPHLVAQEVANEVPDHLLRKTLATALIAIVGDSIRSQRNHQINSNGSSKWKGVAEDIESGVVDFLRLNVFCGEWKFMGECTADDLDYKVDELNEEALELQDTAERYQKIANKMRQKKLTTVSDLPKKEIAKILE